MTLGAALNDLGAALIDLGLALNDLGAALNGPGAALNDPGTTLNDSRGGIKFLSILRGDKWDNNPYFSYLREGFYKKRAV
jgi:hypothetical protein